jgi:hypothetical protein
MKQHYWESMHADFGTVVFEVCIYSSQRSMLRGVDRFTARLPGAVPRKSGETFEGGALCYTYYDSEQPCARMFFTEKTFTPAILAHEAYHAAMYFQRRRTRQRSNTRSLRWRWYHGTKDAIGEEDVAVTLEHIVSSVLKWADAGFPDTAV